MKHNPIAMEINFDGLVGPTHNYAGLAFGNVASSINSGSVSSPKQAAKQGLEKMRILMELGIPQAVLPPHQRPNLLLLRDLGFSGDDASLLQQSYKYQPELLSACYSASSMWTANAATVSPSCNTIDGKLHITPANLLYNLHRAQEAEFNFKLFKKIFSDTNLFNIHKPLFGCRDLGDEGAANHSYLCTDYGVPGLEMYVYGKQGLKDQNSNPAYFPARQTKLASSSVSRIHGLDSSRTIFLQQNPEAIDAGVFHNDVIFVANKNLIFMHTEAFVAWQDTRKQIENYFSGHGHIIEVTSQELSIKEAVETYIFNSQLVSLPGKDNKMALIVPMECQNSAAAKNVLESILAADNPISMIKYVECRESMRNGGGPACLRLRVVLNADEHRSCLQSIMLDDKLYNKLNLWIGKHYRDTLSPQDLLDPSLVNEVYVGLDELTKILGLGSIYPFQT